MIRRRRVAQRAFRIPAAVAAARARLNAINLHEISDGQRVPKRMICGRSSGAAGGSSARRDLNPQVGEISLDLDLNSKTGEESPDRGVHMKTVHLTGSIVMSVTWRSSWVRSRRAGRRLRVTVPSNHQVF
jgi:hypothetical protein